MKRLQARLFWTLVVLFYGALHVHAQSVELSSASKVMAVGPLVYSSHFIDDVPGGTSPNGDGDGRAESGEHVGLAVTLLNAGNQTAIGVESVILTCSDPDITIIDMNNCWPDIPGGQTRENACNYEFQVNLNLAQDKTVIFSMTITAQNGGPWTTTAPVPIYRQNNNNLTAPSNLSASAINNTTAQLFWQDNSSNEQGFKIERKLGATGSYAEIATVGANVTSYTNGNLTSGQTYYYRVRAFIGLTYSNYSNEAGVTLPSLTSDLMADRVYLRSAPNGGGSEVNDPLPGQQYYASIEYRNTGAGTTGNFRWEVKINGNIVCFLEESVVGNSNWVRHCANPIIWPCFSPGASNTLQAVLDVNNSVAESNESNNSVSRTYICTPSCQLTWKVDMTLQDAGSNSALLSFGLGTTATDDIDAACGEAELPPTPPSGIFDARLELPVSPAKASLKDYRNNSQQTVTWRVKFQPGANGPMTFSWNPANFPAGSVSLKDEIIGTLVNVNMKTQSSYTLTNPAGISSLKIELGDVCRDVMVIAGWNVVSIPLLANNMAVSALFPDAASQAFAFNNGYTNAATLTNGKGYWIKFNTAKTYNICGIPVTPKRIPVVAGWNIIGPFETDIPVANITSSPPNIITSSYFGYNNGYTQAATLSVGKGYWVKASAAGELTLPGSAMAKQATETNATRMAPQQEVNNAWPMLVLADSKGHSGRIYLAPATEINADFEMPPVPPVGNFDVRFSSGRYVETLENGALEVQINSASYPIRIKAQNLGDRTLNVKDALGGNALHEALTSGKEIVVSKAIDKIMVETAIQLPSRYALSQNYPNPFNPTTMIRFAVPEKGHVKLTLYSVMGEKLAELVNQELPAGYHQVEFNANNFASGVYFYEMRSGNFRDLKKLLLQK